MAVVGVDIGDHTTHISIAQLGGVETIANDYSLRATPSVVALGERQRLMGVAAENQRNLNPKNSVSFFKNSLGQAYTAETAEIVAAQFGARITRDSNTGRLTFHVDTRKLSPEQCMAMLMTKVKGLVAAATGEDELETLVVSVPTYFSQSQRASVRQAAEIAGLRINELITDTSALALAYGKSRSDLPSDTAAARHVVIIDVGSEGCQAVLAAFTAGQAKVLASSFTHTGGRSMDDKLVEFAVKTIEDKYKVRIESGNLKARNKLRNAMEKAKKQMSANTNAIPVTIDSLVEDKDVQLSVDRATFEELIKNEVADIKASLDNLLDSTTIKPADIHSVEIVGGTTRIPIIKNTIQEVFGLSLGSTLNADEAVSRGCALHAANISPKFITKKFEVVDCVHHGVEAVFVHGGEHERVMVCDEGDSADEEKQLEITADLPLNIALQYYEAECVTATTVAQKPDKLLALYKVEGTEDARAGVFSLKFRFDAFGLLDLKECVLVSEEQHKRRRRRSGSCSSDNSPASTATTGEMVPCHTVLAFTRTMPTEDSEAVARLAAREAAWVKEDAAEVARQETKNQLEEQLYQARHQVTDAADAVDTQEVYTQLVAYFDEIENWLYEEGEDAPASSYLEVAETLKAKLKVYSVWLDKFNQMKAREEERKRFIETQNNNQQKMNSAAAGSRQIPVVYEGDADYVPKMQQRPAHATFPSRFAQRRDPFAAFAGHHRADPFGSMFGWQ